MKANALDRVPSRSIIQGTLVGILTYFVLSELSGLWVGGGVGTSRTLVSVGIVVVVITLGAVVSWNPGLRLWASVAIVGLALLGLLLGNPHDAQGFSLLRGFDGVLRHGGWSPLVWSVGALLLSTTVVRPPGRSSRAADTQAVDS